MDASYVRLVYKSIPSDLGAKEKLPDLDSYLGERFEEEISRIKLKKKNENLIKSYENIEPYCADNEPIDKDPDIEMNIDLGCEDLLLNELYSKERSYRVSIFGIQLDEMWSYVEKKKNKSWIWLALQPDNKQIIALYVGKRDEKSAQKLWEAIPEYYHKNVGFFSDRLNIYQSVFKEDTHFSVEKKSGLTAYIERFNATVRQRCSRLVRKALSFSKSMENHIGAIKYFIWNYNKLINN